MKVCLFEERYQPYEAGGASIYVRRLAHALAGAGHEVMVVATHPFHSLSTVRPSAEMDSAVRVIRFWPVNIYDAHRSPSAPLALKPLFHVINLWNPAQYLQLRGILRQERPDVVHVHTMDGLSLSLFDAARGLGIPLVLTLHGYSLLCRKVTLLRSSGQICSRPNALCSLYRRATRRIIGSKPHIVTSPAQFVLDLFAGCGFFPKSERVKLVNGIELEAPPGAQRGEHAGEFNILFAGRLGRHKGVHTLIQATRRLQHPHVRLHIVGDGDYRGELERLAAGDGRITFHGAVPGSEMPAFYGMADVAVMPSICYEVSPLVIQESFLAGTPVVGSRIGGIPEMVSHGYNGLLFEPGDAEGLAAALRSLVEDRDRLEGMGRNAAESAGAYAMSLHIERVVQLYESAAKGDAG